MKVLFLDTVHSILWDRLTAHNFQCVDGVNLSLKQVLEAVSEYHGIVIRSRFPVDEAFLKAASSLRFVARSGSGMENIDVGAAEARNIAVYNAPEGNRVAVAEHALGMLLSLFNKLIQGDSEVRQGVWDREGNRGIQLAGRTVGIIGYGHNGSAFAKALSGLGCRVMAFDKYISDFGSGNVEEVQMDDIYREADIVSLHIPLTEETRSLINVDFITRMEQKFYLINTSRGKTVQTQAVVDALQSAKISGACLDVLDIEKPSFEMEEVEDTAFTTLCEMKNVILSPHVAGWTIESYEKLSSVLADKILSDFRA